MPSLTALRRTAVAGLAGLALAASAAAASTAAADPTDNAAAQPIPACYVGQVPLTNQNTWVRRVPGFSEQLYTIPAGYGFRITGGPGYADGLVWWEGNGNGQPTGWVPEQNLTCG